MFCILMRMCNEGPAASLSGSPTVSPITDDGYCSLPDRMGDKIVAVSIEALDGYEQVARPDLARVVSQSIDVHVYALRQAQDSVAVNFLVR